MSAKTQPKKVLSDEFIALGETIADLNARFERVEGEISTQAKPLEAAGIALNAAVSGLKALQTHVLDQSIFALSTKLEATRAAIDEQIGIVVQELKRADESNAGKVDSESKELRSELAQLQSTIARVSNNFAREVGRLELEAKKRVEEFAALPKVRDGVDGKTVNPTGSYDSQRAYSRLDIVSYLNGSFISLEDGNTEKPSRKAKKWMPLVIGSAGGAGGDVAGPASSTDNGIPRFDGTLGKTLQTSGATISDTGTLTLTGAGSATDGLLAFPASATTKNQGVSFGGDVFLSRSAVGSVVIEANSGAGQQVYLAFAPNGISSNRPYIGTESSANFLFHTPNGTMRWVIGSTEAFRLDSSQNATAGGTVIGMASTTSKATFRIPHGSAPSAPTDGDMWTTTAGLYVRINGATVGPLS